MKIPKLRPRRGPLRTQTGGGYHRTDRDYRRQPKHRNKER